MESKAFRSLMESAKEVKRGIKHTPEHAEFRKKLGNDKMKKEFDAMSPKDRDKHYKEWMSIQYDAHTDGVDESVIEYFENYFGGELNESTSDEEIIEAVYDLIGLRDAVLEAVGLDEETSRERSLRIIQGVADKGDKYPKQAARAKEMLKRMEGDESITPAVINGVIQGSRLDKKKMGTSGVYKPDTISGKRVAKNEGNIIEYLKHSQVQEPDYKNTDSMFSQEQEFRDFPKKYNAKTMKHLSKKDFAKTKKKLKKIHSRMKDTYGSSLDRDSANQETNDAKGWPSWKTNYH